MPAIIAVINTFILALTAMFENNALLMIPFGLSFTLFLMLVDKGE